MPTPNKVVLVTGGNTGLGYEIVKALYAAALRYDIIIGTRTVSKGEAALKQIQSEIPSEKSTLSVLQVDVTSDASIEAAIAHIDKTHGHLDILINNAGAAFDAEHIAGRMSIRETFNASWDVNVSGTQVLTALAVPLLLKSADPRLLFVTSGTSSLYETVSENCTDAALAARINSSPEKGWPKPSGGLPITSYRSTKTGLNMLMREWTRILKNDGVKVWAISPGLLATGLGGMGSEILKKAGAKDPSEGGTFIRDVVQGHRDQDVGKVIRFDMIQPW